MKSAFEIFLMSVEAFIFCVAVFALLSGLNSNEKIRDYVNDEIHNKNNITETDKLYDDKTVTNVKGSIVFKEILAVMEQNAQCGKDSSIKIIIDGSSVNDIVSPVTGEDIYEIMQNGGNASDLIVSKINLDRIYKKTYSVDKNCNITKITYN